MGMSAEYHSGILEPLKNTWMNCAIDMLWLYNPSSQHLQHSYPPDNLAFTINPFWPEHQKQFYENMYYPAVHFSIIRILVFMPFRCFWIQRIIQYWYEAICSRALQRGDRHGKASPQTGLWPLAWIVLKNGEATPLVFPIFLKPEKRQPWIEEVLPEACLPKVENPVPKADYGNQ